MPTVSRDATEFLRRSGLRITPRVPAPRVAFPELRVEDIPLHRNQLNPNLMLTADGDLPPDRGVADLWPPPQEVQDNPNTSETSE